MLSPNPQTQHLSPVRFAPTPDNPRIFPKKPTPALLELADSLKALGMIQPIIARPHPDQPDLFEIRAGERRWRAAILAKMETIPAIIHTEMTDQEALEITVAENLSREQLLPLEEARGVHAYIARGWGAQAIADKLGKPISWVARRASLHGLTDKWKKAVSEPESDFAALTASHLEVVARLAPEAQDQAYDDLADDYGDVHTMSVADLRRELARLLNMLKFAPWDLEDATLVPKAGSCTECPHRSSRVPDLFDDDPEGGRVGNADTCLSAPCWERKTQAHIKRVIAQHSEEGKDLILLTESRFHERETQEKAYGKPVQAALSYTTSKKPTSDSRPAIYISGPKLGSIVHIPGAAGNASLRTGSPASTRGTGSQSGVGACPPSETPLSILKERKINQRRMHAIGALDDALDGLINTPDYTPPPHSPKFGHPSFDHLIALLAAFGTHHRRASIPNDTYWDPDARRSITKKPWDEAKSLMEDLQANHDEAIIILQKSLVEVFRARIATMFGQAHWDEASHIATAYKFDLAAAYADAERILPDPKAWAQREQQELAAKEAEKPKAKKQKPAKRNIIPADKEA